MCGFVNVLFVCLFVCLCNSLSLSNDDDDDNKSHLRFNHQASKQVDQQNNEEEDYGHFFQFLLLWFSYFIQN